MESIDPCRDHVQDVVRYLAHRASGKGSGELLHEERVAFSLVEDDPPLVIREQPDLRQSADEHLALVDGQRTQCDRLDVR